MSQDVFNPDKDTTYLPARKVLERYSISDMTLWRWLANPTLNFPKPLRINRFRYFATSELDAWDAERRAA